MNLLAWAPGAWADGTWAPGAWQESGAQPEPSISGGLGFRWHVRPEVIRSEPRRPAVVRTPPRVRESARRHVAAMLEAAQADAVLSAAGVVAPNAAIERLRAIARDDEEILMLI